MTTVCQNAEGKRKWEGLGTFGGDTVVAGKSDKTEGQTVRREI